MRRASPSARATLACAAQVVLCAGCFGVSAGAPQDASAGEDATRDAPPDSGGAPEDVGSAPYDTWYTWPDDRAEPPDTGEADDAGITQIDYTDPSRWRPLTEGSHRELGRGWALPIAAGDGTLVADESGNVFLDRAIPWTASLNEGAMNDARARVLVTSIDANGATRWVVRTTGEAPAVRAMVPTEDGGLALAFHCAGEVNRESIRCAAGGGGPLVLARFDASGALQWTHTPSVAAAANVTLRRNVTGDLYLFAAGSWALPTLLSFTPAGVLRWSHGALPVSARATMSLAPEGPQVVSWEPGTRSTRIAWARVRPDGTTDAVGDFRVEVSFNSWRIPTQVVMGPNHDIYVARTGRVPGTSDRWHAVELDCFSSTGEFRWASDYSVDGTLFQSLDLDVAPSGTICWHIASGTAPRTDSRPIYTTCWDDSSWRWTPTSKFLYMIAPDGWTLEAHYGTGMEYCHQPTSRRFSFTRTTAPATVFTLGDRTEPIASSTVVAQLDRSPDPVCTNGEHPCAGACVNTAASADHCGACGRTCRYDHGVGRCHGGGCYLGGCQDGYADCNGDPADGCEVDLTTSRDHCGTCGRACGARACQRGLCCEGARCEAPFASDGREGAFAPTSGTTLPAGVHQFTTVTIPAGVTVRTDGDGVLELRATGDVRIDGVIDLSGGNGANPSVSGASLPGAGGGHTGRTTTAPAGMSGAAGGGRGEQSPTTPSLGSRQGGAPAAAGGGVAGGGGGRSVRGSGVCDCMYGESAAGPDGGRAGDHVWGGHAWGAPYEGRGRVPFMRGCYAPPPPQDPYDRMRYYYGYDEGVPGGGGSIGRAAAADLAVHHTFGPGSGGGGGGSVPNLGSTNMPGGGGGGGGGALRITSATRIVVGATARVLADGGAGGRNAGAGSGGLVYLMAPEVRAARGSLFEAIAQGVPAAPVAGLGRIRLSVDSARCALEGTFNPPLVEGCRATSNGGQVGRVFIAPWPL